MKTAYAAWLMLAWFNGPAEPSQVIGAFKTEEKCRAAIVEYRKHYDKNPFLPKAVKIDCEPKGDQ